MGKRSVEGFWMDRILLRVYYIGKENVGVFASWLGLVFFRGFGLEQGNVASF